MTESTVDIVALRDVLLRLEALLSLSPWQAILRDIRQGLASEASQREAVKTLQSYFGGMGSLNDIILCQENQNLPPGRGMEEAKKELDDLLDEIFGYLVPDSSPADPSELPPRIRYAFRATE
jgi:hypothetical protein